MDNVLWNLKFALQLQDNFETRKLVAVEGLGSLPAATSDGNSGSHN